MAAAAAASAADDGSEREKLKRTEGEPIPEIKTGPSMRSSSIGFLAVFSLVAGEQWMYVSRPPLLSNFETLSASLSAFELALKL